MDVMFPFINASLVKVLKRLFRKIKAKNPKDYCYESMQSKHEEKAKELFLIPRVFVIMSLLHKRVKQTKSTGHYNKAE